MSIFDVNTDTPIVINEIRWSTEAPLENPSYNLIKGKTGGVTMKDRGLRDILRGGAALCETAEETRSLIKALEKAIDLGWVE
jgi:hypothetical protein